MNFSIGFWTYWKKEKTLKEIFRSAKTIPGTIKYHFFKPINDCTLKVKITSLHELYSCGYKINFIQN